MSPLARSLKKLKQTTAVCRETNFDALTQEQDNPNKVDCCLANCNEESSLSLVDFQQYTAFLNSVVLI